VPLFIEELTKAILESGLVVASGDRPAATGPVTQRFRRRPKRFLVQLDRLAPAREVAQIAAALGRQFSHELISVPRYNPARGGHAPGDLRTVFEEAVEAICDWNEGDPEPTIEVRGREMAVSAVCGLLWTVTISCPRGPWNASILISAAGAMPPPPVCSNR
jgi:hypothetical protein